jgi:probable rRNA maturation factor
MKVDVIYAVDNPSNCPDVAFIKKCAQAALKNRNTQAEVAIKIIDEAEMTQLNAQYRHKEKPTNVLSFPSTFAHPLKKNQLGDIAICASVVEQEAIAQNKPLQAHWAHMVIHGVLHLLGYDHEQEEQALIMEDLERVILHECGFDNPYDMEINHV